jgi:hypothetical protein
VASNTGDRLPKNPASITPVSAYAVAADQARATLPKNSLWALQAEGISWKRIAAEIGVGVGTIYRIVPEGSKIQERVI